jgi:hypothetical protein
MCEKSIDTSGRLVRPTKISGPREPGVKDTLGFRYDSKEKTLEFHPSNPSFLIVDESKMVIVFTLFNLLSFRLNVPFP